MIFSSNPGKNEYGRVEIYSGWVKNEGAKKVLQNHIYIYKIMVSYALKVSVNGVIYVFVAHFRSSSTFESL